MTRRGLLLSLVAGSIGSVWKGKESAAQLSSMKEIETLQKNWRALLADGVTAPLPTEKLKLSKEEWRKRLQPNNSTFCARRAPNAPARARSTTRSALESSHAPAAACRCSLRI